MLEANHHEITRTTEAVEPLDDWIHVRTSYEDERPAGLVVVSMQQAPVLERSIVLAVGEAVRDVRPGDLVLAAPSRMLPLRDGTRLVQRTHVVARVRD